MSLGENIKRIREERELAQEKLAAKCGITKQSIYLIENGKNKNPGINMVEKIANVLDTTIEELTKK